MNESPGHKSLSENVLPDSTSPTDRLALSWALEAGRNEVLRMVVQGKPLAKVLNLLCHKAQIYNAEMICSVLLLDETNTLHPIASISLPERYCQALEGMNIGPCVGSCGTAAFTKKRVIVEDINTHPSWASYKTLALDEGLQACWSEPIIGQQGNVFGTFAMYYRQPTSPTPEDLNFIEVSANLAAVVFENDAAHQALITANKSLSQTVDQRNKQLETANQHLLDALESQEQSQLDRINAEKILTTNNLLSGFAHEVNTPIGIAVTAISTAEDQLNKLMTAFESGKLTRKVMADKVAQIKQAITLNKSNLDRTSQLLSSFKAMDFSLDKSDTQSFELSALFSELPQALASLLKGFKLKIDSEPMTLHCSRTGFWQMMQQLIENSVLHGFHGRKTGLIYICAVKQNKKLIINYQDNGCGIKEELQQQIFEPFYSTERTRGSIGLGLNVVNNIITNSFGGTIRCLKSPSGIRFEIVLPLTD